MAVWKAAEAVLDRMIAKQEAAERDEARKLDAPPPPADGDMGALRKAIRSAADEAIGGVKKDVESSSRVAAERTNRHTRREALRIGIRLADAEPNIAKQVAGWRKENVARITGMVDDQLGKIERILDEGEGRRVESLAKDIRRQCEDVSASRAELIARDQVLTLHSQITTARMKDAGVEKFIWTTSGDERVRESHEELDGQTFSYDDPPDVDGEAALPGEPVLCRCVAYPVLPELGDED